MNFDRILELLITAVPPTLMAAAVYWKGDQIHTLMNSRMSELLELARKESAAQATLDEKLAEHVRKGEAAIADAKKVEDKRSTQ